MANILMLVWHSVLFTISGAQRNSTEEMLCVVSMRDDLLHDQ